MLFYSYKFHDQQLCRKCFHEVDWRNFHVEEKRFLLNSIFRSSKKNHKKLDFRWPAVKLSENNLFLVNNFNWDISNLFFSHNREKRFLRVFLTVSTLSDQNMSSRLSSTT
uniref:(northern house mosquito) hypothetical protein n=1 Tax=Culex pipiens TaxID=7175 RepID=A0A8D8H636_CULPI